MSADKNSNNTNADENNIVPYETLKASLDAAAAEMGERYTELVGMRPDSVAIHTEGADA